MAGPQGLAPNNIQIVIFKGDQEIPSVAVNNIHLIICKGDQEVPSVAINNIQIIICKGDQEVPSVGNAQEGGWACANGHLDLELCTRRGAGPSATSMAPA